MANAVGPHSVSFAMSQASINDPMDSSLRPETELEHLLFEANFTLNINITMSLSFHDLLNINQKNTSTPKKPP